MIQTVRVHSKDNIFIYRLEGITTSQATFLAKKLLCETIHQTYTLNKPFQTNGKKSVEIAYKPGVMNPQVASIIKAAKDLGVTLTAADVSREYPVSSKEAVRQKLFNPTIEHVVAQTPRTLLITGKHGPTLTIPIRVMSNKELLELSQDKLFLNLEEMKTIQNYFLKIKRDPTDCELETLAQTWSEHCAHKTFKATIILNGKKKKPLIERIKKEALRHNKHTVSAFIDNSGVMNFYEDLSICGKVETHNSPSAIEPYGGAMTGSGGVFRDILGTGLGAKTIASTDIFCFANPNLSSSKLPAGCLPPKYLLKRVVAGVRDYGNRMGIPTNNGSIHFHDDFRAKPTIIVGAYGLIPTKKAQKGKPQKGDVIIAVGGKTGRDGIHGATFSSGEMTDRTLSVNSSAVQIGNAIEEKRMFDALIEARDRDLIRALQDCGAGGFSSAIGELGEKIGVKIDLARAPVKYQGMSPWEIWVSESQERMVAAVERKQVVRFIAICKKYNVETAELGVFDGSKKLQIYFGKKRICMLDMDFLHNGLPQRTMIAKKPKHVIPALYVIPAKAGIHALTGSRIKSGMTETESGMTVLKTQKQWTKTIVDILSHGNICSKEPIVRLYDHTVQGTNILQPYIGEKLDGPTDAAVMKPMLNKPYGMIIAHGLNPVFNNIDPYRGSIWALVEALANYVAVGGNYQESSLINNYVWPFPDEESLWSLDQSVDAVVDGMRAFKIPVISGKDSLSSTYRGKNGEVIKIPPVLCISVFGKISDVKKIVSSDFKKTDSSIYLVGKLDLSSMNGSVPKIDLVKTSRVFKQIHRAISKGKILSCHDVSEGGLLTTIFEMCVGGNMGAALSISQKFKPDQFLFNETAGCFVIELAEDQSPNNFFKNIPFIKLGKTQNRSSISASQNRKTLFDIKLGTLKKAWQKPMRDLFL